MKKNLLILLITLVVAVAGKNNAIAQSGSVILGTWEYKLNGDVFKLVFEQPTSFKLPNGTLANVIVGRYSYVRNGVVVSQSSNILTKDGNSNFDLIAPYNVNTKIKMLFTDSGTRYKGSVYLEYVSGAPAQIKWILKADREVVSINNPSNSTFSVPLQMTLQRVP